VSRIPPTYRVADSTFRIDYGDLTKSRAEALVSSDDNYLTMGGGVSKALLNAGGPAIQVHARKLIPLSHGEVAVTTAGSLPAKYIFHAVTIDLDHRRAPDTKCVRTLVTRSFELANALRIRSIAFPALGTGVGGFPFHEAADVLVRTICDQLIQATSVEEATVLLLAREGVQQDDLSTFYERAVALASVAGQGKRLASAVNRLQEVIGEDSRPGLKEALEDVLAEIRMGVTALEGHPRNAAEIDSLQQGSKLEDAGRRIVELTEDDRRTDQWRNRRVERNALQTRHDGLATLLNVHYGSLNKLELDKAQYGGIGVPVLLANQIQEVKSEIERVEHLMQETQRKIEGLPLSRVTGGNGG